MVFSSPHFLFLFLPVVLLLYFGPGRWTRNAVLLVASLFFYAWGEVELVLVMILSIVANYGFGLWMERARARGRAHTVVALSVAFNLGLLVFFKYANWLWENGSWLVAHLGLAPGGLPPLARVLGPPLETLRLVDGPLPDDWTIRLPIGISFFTFQAMSYIVDVYRRDAEVQRNPVHFGVYIALFPQLIAGPIVRYRHVAEQIVSRVVTLEGFAWGVRRFVVGLGKKMLVANVVAQPADAIFAIPEGQLSAPVAWLGILCYTLQIYFDFSGYSDMAIGLGRMFGFRFLENFDFPYVSRSITEFWRRWHISLSSWFRDYLYIPLGGNRRGTGRTYANLLIVFFLCGLWHGASWSFIVWGLFHGAFLVLERMGLRRVLEGLPSLVRHAYALLVVVFGWVFFRAETLDQALHYASAMLGLGPDAGAVYTVPLYLDRLRALVILAGIVGSLPWLPRLVAWRDELARAGRGRIARPALEVAGLLGCCVLFLLSAMEMAAGTYNPFIYFRF